MKQKISINVHMTCEKCKKKVMKIAATTPGVKSVEVVGEISDGKITVIGVDVDSVSLTRNLRKKVGRTILESVEQVKEEKKAEESVPKVEFTEYPYVFYPSYYPPYSLVNYS